MSSFSPLFRVSLFSLVLISCAQSQTASPKASLRTLIISGGPSADYNQYAIESNARYVEKLTTGGNQRVLFANGNRNSRTISTYKEPVIERELAVLLWILDEDSPYPSIEMKAPTLKRLDGSTAPKTIIREVESLAKNAKAGERALLYFTGHGGEGEKKGLFGSKDYDNTNYNGWGGDLSMQSLAPALQKWPANVPLTLVMVQCHSGGFANLIWKDGDTKKGIWPRDFCGFFAATGDRMSSGCTSEVDERDYQDFTTHFFAALSGVSRDGRPISGADYDRNGAVSGLEAFAYTNLNDHSIDVPMCTSDLYLRRTLGEKDDNGWMQTPYSAILNEAAPWQKAILNGLSRELKLSGDKRIGTVYNALKNFDSDDDESDDDYGYSGLSDDERDEFTRHFYNLKADVKRRFPALKSKKSPNNAASKTKAIAYLKTRPAEVASVYKAYQSYQSDGGETSEVREAKLLRFLRTSYTIALQKRLKEKGTAEQKATFARLRTSESRNFLK